MPIYSVEGKLGTGKTKFCVWMAQQAMLKKRRVASNVDLDCTKLYPWGKRTYVRVPDKPTAFDLLALGPGNPESYDEDRNGVLILDELGTWLNARSFQDKDRAHLLDWLIHARKYGWDVYLIVQDAGMIDKQVREALIEYQCRCMRMDKVRIPIIGRILGLVHERLAYLPKFHLVTARVGYGTGAIVADRWSFLGKDLHAAYDTRQVFRSDYPHGAYSALLPWDWAPRLGAWERLKALWQSKGPKLAGRSHALRPKLPLVEHLQRLPVERRLYWHRRLSMAGMI